MKRAEILEQLAAHSVYDLVVIGGGATGLGVALDAALRGYSVALFESHDFAAGTSSRSTKLLHGGVRYLAQGDIALVREALAERRTVMHNAPHLAQALPFVMPAYHCWQLPFYGTGLMAYDLLAGAAGLGRTRFLNRAQVLAALPGVCPNDLRGGVQYWDGQFDDARLALALARTAERAGAQLLNYAEVRAVDALPAPDPLGARLALTLFDLRRQAALTVRARCVVNAAGVWVDALRSGHGAEPLVSPSQGVHLVVDRDFMPGEHALLVPKTRDGRVLFVVPWLGSLILGTTDTPREDMPREPQPLPDELDFLLRESARALTRPVRREDVRSVWVGLRPLVAQGRRGEGGTRHLSREHSIVTDDEGMVTVTGGKWTTYRAMAQQVLQRCCDAGLLPPRGPSRTSHHLLVGAEGAQARMPVPIHAPPGLHLYGSQAAEVLACPGAQRELGMGLTEAMVRYAARCEHAWTVEDMLARRWRALFLDAAQAMRMAPQVAAILQEETGEDPQLAAFLTLAAGYLLH